MAAIDTIEVLDNLQFTHENTADIYSVHTDGFAGEAVESVAIPIDCEKIFGLRVIVNNNYGATGSTVVAKVRMTGLTGLVALSKYQNIEMMDWTSFAIGAAPVAPVEANLSTVRSGMLHLFCAITGTVAHLGTEFIVQVRNEATVSEWTKLFSFVMCSGKTAFKLDVKSTAAAGQKVVPVDNPVSGLLNHLMKNIFILDATIANSEVCFQVASGADS